MLDGCTSGAMKCSGTLVVSYKSTSHPRKGGDLVERIMGYRRLCLLEKNTSGVVLYVSGTGARLWKAGRHGQPGWELKRMC